MKEKKFKAVAASLSVLLIIVSLAGCGASLQSLTGLSLPTANASTPSPATSSSAQAPVPVNTSFKSSFTKNGAMHIYTNIEGIDYVMAIYPSQATPDVNKWYPNGNKLFSMNLQAYDLSKDLRAPYGQKRQVYLSTVSITSTVTASSGNGDGSSSSFMKYGDARQLTFDPEAVTYMNYGIRLTSPKGIFEMRNQAIGNLPTDTIGITLHFQYFVNVQRNAGGTVYDPHTVNMDVPIGITPSSQATPTTMVPVDAS